MPDANHDPFGLPIAQALQGLPLESPDASVLPLLRTEIRRARRRRWGLAFAAAAALAMVALLPRVDSLRGSAPPTEPPAHASADLQQLMHESARLEALAQRLRDPAVASASDVLLDLAFEDRMRQIDAELAAAGLESTRRSDLWRLRIALLRSSMELDSARRLLDAENDNPRPVLVSAH